MPFPIVAALAPLVLPTVASVLTKMAVDRILRK